MNALLRWVGFVLVNATLVALYLAWLVDALPVLHSERALIVLPATLISASCLVAMHPVLRRSTTHLGRLGVLLGAAFVAMLGYTGYVLSQIGSPHPGLAGALAFGWVLLLVQGIAGAPLVLGIAVTNKLLSPLLLARPARAVW